MPYKLNKIIFQREHTWGYESYTYDLNTTLEFPYVAGKMQELVPTKPAQIGKYKPEISDQQLFNEKGLTKLIPEVGPKGIYYLELRPGYKLNQLYIEPEDVIVDIFIGAKDTLIYSFYNPTRRNFISITAASEKDKDNIYNKIKTDKDDIYWRQYFIRLSMNKDSVQTEVIFPENMTVVQVANYLQLEIKTIRNWTSEGKIPSVKIGSAVRYPKAQINRWLIGKEKKKKVYK